MFIQWLFFSERYVMLLSMKNKYLLFIIGLLIVVILPIGFCRGNTQVGLPEGAIARLGKGGINVLCFSPDGSRLAVGSDIGVRLYDINTKEEIDLPNRVLGQINAIAFSNDSRILACGGYFNPIIQLWDIENRRDLPSIPSSKPNTYIEWEHFPIYAVIALSFSKDGNTLIGVSEEGRFTYWDINSQQIEAEQQQYTFLDTYASTLSHDGSLFLIGSENGNITLYDTQTGSIDADINGHEPKFTLFSKPNPRIRALAFSADGSVFASGSKDMTVRLWDTKSRKRKATLKGHKAWITAVALSQNGDTAASGDAHGEIRIWNTRRKRLQKKLEDHSNSITTLTFSPDGKTFASGSADGTIKLWNPNTWKEPVTLDSGYTEWVRAVAFSSDSTTVSTAMFNNTVQIYDVNTGDKLKEFTDAHQKVTRAVSLSPDATLLACHPEQGNIVFNAKQKWHTEYLYERHEKIQIWDLEDGQELPPLINAYGSIVFSPDSKTIASGTNRSGWGDRMAIWNVRTGKKTRQLPSIDNVLTFSPDGTKLVAEGESLSFETLIWDVESSDISHRLKEDVDTAAFSRNGTMLATVYSYDITLWDTETGKMLHKILPRGENTTQGSAITFSPDGSILLVSKVSPVMSFPSDFIEIIDIMTGDTLRSLPGHTEPIETLVFSHDGKTLASGSMDGTVLLWDWKKIISKAKEYKGN